MKGWNYWGTRGESRFRAHLHSSIAYVLEEPELAGVFNKDLEKKLLIFTTRVRRCDGKPFEAIDRARFFLKSATRKLPPALKYLPRNYFEDPVIFARNLPEELRSEYVRPLTRRNCHAVIEASCLVPVAMGKPLIPQDLQQGSYPGDHHSVFMDGGYALKMPMRLFERDPRFQAVGEWAHAGKTIIFCCDPMGHLWETSARLHRLNDLPSVMRAAGEDRLLVIHPDHKVEAGFLCVDHATTMRTFHRGQEQAHRLLSSGKVRAFLQV